MMTLEDIKLSLKDRALRISDVSQKTGLHDNTIRDIRDNPTANPTLKTLQALSDYLEDRNNAKN